MKVAPNFALVFTVRHFQLLPHKKPPAVGTSPAEGGRDLWSLDVSVNFSLLFLSSDARRCP